jgi:hypothetical protein
VHVVWVNIRVQLEGTCGADALVRQVWFETFAGGTARATRANSVVR